MDFSKLTPAQENECALQAVGQAISSWARVEHGLCEVFTACISPAHTIMGDGFVAPGAPAVVFYSIENFRTKLLITDRIYRFHVTGVTHADHLIKCWQRTYDHTRRLSGRRNLFAHWNMVQFGDRKPGQRSRLMPPFLSTAFREEISNRQGGLALPDILRLADAFIKLSQSLTWLSRGVAAHQELRSKFLTPIPALMHNLGQQDPTALARVKRDLSWPE